MKNTQAAAVGTATETTVPRTKANYDLVKGQIIEALTKTPGTHLNGLNAAVGETSKAKEKIKFTVIYAAVRQMKEDKIVFGTGAKKNEGLYLSEAEAIKHKPEPRAIAGRKADSNYTLEKLIEVGSVKADDKWKVIEGNEKKELIEANFETASKVPGSVFRVMDNTGEEPKQIKVGKITRKEAAKVETKKEEVTA